MDIFEMRQAIEDLDRDFWKKVLQARNVEPTARHVHRLKRHFFNWWCNLRQVDLPTAWMAYVEDASFASFIEACQQGQLSRSEIYNLLRDGFGTLGVYKTSYRNEIRQVMEPLVAAGLVEHRVVRGGGHYWQPDHLEQLAFEEYLQMLTDVAFEHVNSTCKAA